MYPGILSTIGHTPFIPLKRIYQELPVNYYAKMEMFNPGGSIKDRPAFMMLSKAIEEGKTEEGAAVIESSSGNMAIGLAQACCYFGLNLIVVVDPKINGHTMKILQTYGAQIEKVTRPDENGNYLKTRLQRVRELLNQLPDSYWPNQYSNKYNPAAHYQTMEEIVQELPKPPDYLLAATSTCGTIMGCADYVQQHKLDTKIVAVDAAGSVIFGTKPADRLVPGHGAGRPSELLQKNVVDHVLHITDEECVIGCRRLLQREAILAGGSSGAVVMAAEKLQANIPNGSTCALILADSGERYLDTVFNDGWVKEHFGEIDLLHGNNTNRKNSEILFSVSNAAHKLENGRTAETKKIAIIGGGPKGMYGFERLAAQFKAHASEQRVEVHVYNRSSHFGAGDIYSTDQPEYLLMNNPVGAVNMWIDEEPLPVSEPLSLTKWLRQKGIGKVTENDFVDRAAAGRYLEEGFERIASSLPDNMDGKYMIGEVTDLYKNKEKYAIKLKTAAGSSEEISHRYDHILLATGHPRNQATEQEKKYSQFADKKDGIGFIPFIYPVEPALRKVLPGSKIGIKGIGLTFVDAVLALSEGKRGKFKRDSVNNKLVYEASGNEPEMIYPFSRSGLPMITREPAPKNEVPLKFFTEKTLQNHQAEVKVDFKKQILPLIKQEMTFAFYNSKMKQTGFKNDLSACATFAEAAHYITLFHEQHPDAERFEPNAFLKPLTDKRFQDSEAFNRYIQSYLEFFLVEERCGKLKSPWAAVIEVWRKAVPTFGACYAFGGLSPNSQRFFDTIYHRLLSRVTFGEPVESGEKLVALMEAGILNFEMAQNPAVVMDEKTDMFVLKSDQYGIRQPVHYLIDARISKVSLGDDRSSLYQILLERGLIRMYKNESGQDSYQPGCIDLSPEGFVIDREGAENRAIAVTGTPTEGITFDNDALSRNRNNFVSGWAAIIRKLYTKSTLVNHAPR